jgi:hypothetical protein
MNLKDLQVYNTRGSLYYALSYLFIIQGAFGIIITALVLHTSIRVFLKTKNPNLKISFAILVTDLIFSIMLVTLGISAFINGNYLATNSWYCGLVDILYMGTNYISIWYVALMSLDRGLLIIHKINLPMKFWLSVMACELILFLILNIISISLNQMGLANLATYCMSTPDYPTGYVTIIWYCIMMVVSLAFVIYSYIGIAVFQRRKAWRDIRELNLDKDETLKLANRIITKVIILLFLFLFSNLTEIINTMYETITGRTRSSTVDFWSIILLNFNPTINCVILIQFQEPVKNSLLEIYPFVVNIIECLFGRTHVNSALNNSLD